tara:strand:- start:1352 stop:1618 length:267 start_codon:yes stop_codon:yes gene_type:complete
MFIGYSTASFPRGHHRSQLLQLRILSNNEKEMRKPEEINFLSSFFLQNFSTAKANVSNAFLRGEYHLVDANILSERHDFLNLEDELSF